MVASKLLVAHWSMAGFWRMAGFLFLYEKDLNTISQLIVRKTPNYLINCPDVIDCFDEYAAVTRLQRILPV